jgi:DNA polymerase V
MLKSSKGKKILRRILRRISRDQAERPVHLEILAGSRRHASKTYPIIRRKNTMTTLTRKIIPIAAQESDMDDESNCAGTEPFALMVLGDSMVPEFNEGEIIIIEPGGLSKSGSYILAFHNEEYIFRQLIKREEGWCLHALNERYPDEPIADLSVVKGVIIQKSIPGKRSASKNYITKAEA